MKYPYMLVIGGEVEAKDKEHAHLIVQMSFALVGRLLAQRHTVSIQVEEPISENSKEAMEVTDG